MMNDAHQKVTPRHQRRAAYLYVRQSTLRQVLENTESTARQYALRQRAVALGWSQEQVIVIDSDQGPVRRIGDGAGWLSAARRGGGPGARGDRDGPGGVAAGAELDRLAPAAGDLRAD